VPTETTVPTEAPVQTEIKDAKNVTMIYIPAGEFTLGSDTGGDIASRPAQKIDLAAFYIDKYEVTNEMYDACVYAVECRKPTSMGSAKRNTYYKNPVFANYPVIYVNWKMANAYCEWRGGRLPTEAEWEKAARGAQDERIYPWEGGELSCGFANYQSCNGDTTPVDQYEKGKSPYGVYDMAGNVWEWTSTMFKPYPYDAADGREEQLKPGDRIIRGGGWGLFLGSASIRVDVRLKVDPNYSGSAVGFRCALPATP
jgi:eukaryotic-like serine/threonine-protein kinase